MHRESMAERPANGCEGPATVPRLLLHNFENFGLKFKFTLNLGPRKSSKIQF